NQVTAKLLWIQTASQLQGYFFGAGAHRPVQELYDPDPPSGCHGQLLARYRSNSTKSSVRRLKFVQVAGDDDSTGISLRHTCLFLDRSHASHREPASP